MNTNTYGNFNDSNMYIKLPSPYVSQAPTGQGVQAVGEAPTMVLMTLVRHGDSIEGWIKGGEGDSQEERRVERSISRTSSSVIV